MSDVTVESLDAERADTLKGTARVLERLGRQSVAYALASVVGPGTGLLLLPVYTRFLAPADYGLIALLEIISLVLSAVFSLGLTAIVPFYYVEMPAGPQRRRAMGTVLVCATLLNAALAVATATLGRPIVDAVLPGVPFLPFVPLLAVTALLDPYWAVFGSVLQIQERASAFSAASVARIVLSMVLRILAVAVLNRGVYGFIVANLLTSLITAAVVVPFLCRESAFTIVVADLKRAFALGAPTVPNNLLTYGFRTMDRVIMSRFVGQSEIGLYYMALRIADVMRLIADVFISAWRPIFFKEAGDAAFTGTVVPAVMRAVSVGFIAFWLIVSLFAPEAIAVLTAPAYHAAAVFVPVLVAAMVVKGLYAFPYLVVWFRKRTVYVPLLTLATLGFSLVANLTLAPRLGAQGVALALLLSYLLLFALMVVLAQRLLAITYPWKAMLLAAGIASVAVVAGSRLDVTLAGGLAKLGLIAAVATAFLAVGVIRFSDIQRALTMARATIRAGAGGLTRWA